MMNQGLVQIEYSRNIKDVSSIESHGDIPFEIPYQRREARASFHISVPISSEAPIQIPTPIPFQIIIPIIQKSLLSSMF